MRSSSAEQVRKEKEHDMTWVSPSVMRDGLTLTQRLKQSTREVHERLHEHPIMAALLSPQLSRQQYINILVAFYGFYRPCEFAVKEMPCITTSRVTWLEADLNALQYNINQVALCEIIPDLQTFSNYLGYHYVVEGSSLGGQVIYRQIQVTLGLTPQTGARFFHGYGKNTAATWRETLALLESQVSHVHDEIVCSAIETFLCLERWLWHCHERTI